MAPSATREILVNARFRRQRVTGVQRVAAEITQRLATPTGEAIPGGATTFGRGHLWEQAALPWSARGRTIWSPCNTGPLMAENQVVTIHDAAVFDHPEWFAPAFARLYHNLLPLLAKRVRRIVTVSEYSRRALARALGIPEAHISVVSNGVDTRFSPSAPSRPDVLPAALRGRPYFVALSTLEPRKNLKLIFQAWQLARDRLPLGYGLLVVGGAGAAAVFKQAHANPVPGDSDASVVYSGYVDDADLPALLSGATALLYPSLYEGFGLPALEAMACGTAVVTTALTSMPEVCGDAAIYVDAYDPASLAGALIDLANDDQLRDGHASRGLGQASAFTWGLAAQRMDAIFAHVQ